MLKNACSLFLLACFATPLAAQKEGNVWCFGNRLGLDFNKNPPALLRNTAINTYEGCSSIADRNGALVLYTDGVTVWNRFHEVVENGADLGGHPSSTQSGIIAAKPGNDSVYYVFTVDCSERNLRGGLQYSEVAVSANQGHGRVTRKNIPLIAPTAEKVTAVAHTNGTSLWIITHKWASNQFYAFLVDEQGVHEQAVISAVGMVHGGRYTNAIGCLKAAPQGDKLAIALHESKLVEVFHFDAATGKVSDPRRIPLPDGKPYGLEFSPDGRFLYTTTLFGGEVAQFDLSVFQSTAVQKSKSVLRPADGRHRCALQLAPDGKIYVAAEPDNFLGVIQWPEKSGKACGYREKALALPPKSGRFGLPTFIQTYFRPPPVAPPAAPAIEFWLEITVQTSDRKPVQGADLTFPDENLPTPASGQVVRKIVPENEASFAVAKTGFFRQVVSVPPAELEAFFRQNPAQRYPVVVTLEPIVENREIVLEDIFYDYEDARLRWDALPALQRLLKILTDNPTLRIQLSAHTDCRGNDAYNLDLSRRRAQSVVDYLLEKGIPPERLRAEGYGETQPLETCACDHCTEAQHQRNRRTTFKVLR